MRNLKRALSLALASVMVLGLMVVGTGASYADVTSEQNQEAIEVLQAVGIMVGDDNGNFNPDAKVTRNEMAVIMSNLMDYRVATYSGTSPFTDVPSWAEPYVAACWTNGITAGITATVYGGSQEVTTAQAALMTMKALGYFQYQSDFADDWQLATVSQANKIDLFEDVDSGVREAMTRNDVAQLVLNALEAGTVEADDDTIKVSTNDGTTVEAGKVKYNYITSGRDYATAINDRLTTAIDGSNTSGAIVELGEKLYNGDLTKKEDTDVFGRPANIWEYQAKEVGTYANEADHTFTAKVTSKALYNAIGKTATDSYSWTVSVDGETQDKYTGKVLNSNKTDDDQCFLQKGISAAADLRTGNGVLTQVYVDGTEKTVDIAVIHYYSAEVYKVNEDDGTITLASFYGDAQNNDEFETSDFEEDDIVMYSFANNEIQEVYAADRMEGEVTRVRANTSDSEGDHFIADGTTYKYNTTMKAADRLLTENVNNDVVAYLDAYGYVAYIDESAVTYDYAYVLSVGDEGDKFGTETNKGKTVYARLVLTDGTIIKVETDTKFTDRDTIKNRIVAYSVDKNNVYTLTVKDGNTSTTSGTVGTINGVNLKIENGVASFYTNKLQPAATRYTANSNTVFIVADSDPDSYDDYSFSIYTGVKNVPDIGGNLTGTKVDVAATDEGVAKVVYIEDADVSGTDNVIFIRAASDAKLEKDSEIGDYYIINAVMNGETATLKVKTGSSAAAKLVTGIDRAGGLVLDAKKVIVAAENITVNSDDLVTSVKLFGAQDGDGDGYITGEATSKSEKETVGLDGTRYAWNDDVAVVRYDYKGDFSVSRIGSIKDDDNDKFLAVTDGWVLNGVCIREVDGGEGSGGGGDKPPQTGNLPTILKGSKADITTSTVALNGRLNLAIAYTAPEFAAKGTKAAFKVEVYANGKLYDVVDFTGVGSKTLGSDGTATFGYTSPINAYPTDAELTFKMIDEAVDDVKVQYVDADNKTVLTEADVLLANGTTKATDAATVGTAGDLSFNYNSNDTSSGKLTYTITGIEETGTGFKNVAMQAGTNNVHNTVGANQITATGTDYVTVTIAGISKLTTTYTITVISDKALGGSNNLVPSYDGAGDDLQFTVTAGKTSGIQPGEKVAVTLAAGTNNTVAKADGAGVKVTFDIGGEEFVMTFKNDNTTTPDNVVKPIIVNSNVTVKVKSVEEIKAPTITKIEVNDQMGDGKLDKDTVGLADTVTIYFSEKITAAPTVNVAGTLDFETGVLADDGMSVTYDVKTNPAATDTIEIGSSNSIVSHATGVCNGANITINVNGLTLTVAP